MPRIHTLGTSSCALLLTLQLLACNDSSETSNPPGDADAAGSDAIARLDALPGTHADATPSEVSASPDATSNGSGDATSSDVSASPDAIGSVVDSAADVQGPVPQGDAAVLKDFGSCGSFTPCGGDIVGRWKAQDMCFGTLLPACDGYISTITISELTYEFSASGTVTEQGVAKTTYDMRINDACAQAFNMPNAASHCTVLDNADAGAAPTADGGIAAPTFRCQMSNGECLCHVDGSYYVSAGRNAYTTSGSTLTTTGDAGDAAGIASTSGQYCVSGDRLSLYSVDVTGFPVMTRFVRE